MIRTASFWKEEGDAPLLNLDLDYLASAYNPEHADYDTDASKETRTKVDAMTSAWPELVRELASKHGVSGGDAPAGDDAAPREATVKPGDLHGDSYETPGRPLGSRGALSIPETPRDGIDRIFVADAERTFRDPTRRTRFVSLLSTLADRFGDYHQGMSYVVSFLLLVVSDEPAVIAGIVDQLNDSPFYFPDRWCAEAVRFATDAHAFAAMLAERSPAVTAALGKACLLPDTYCQKWMVGMCVHVLPFRSLLDFLDDLVKNGHSHLFKFALAAADNLSSEIEAGAEKMDIGRVLSLLRLDKDAFGDSFEKRCAEIVAAAKDVDVSAFDVEALRKTAYEVTVWPRVKRARAMMAEEDSDSEIVFSDETTEEEDEVDKIADGVAAAKVN